jgi:hypothetical protein
MSKDTHVFLHRMTPRAEGYSLGAGARRFLQSPLPRREGSAPVGIGDETGRQSGLHVAVLDRGSVFPWVVTRDEPTDYTAQHEV